MTKKELKNLYKIACNEYCKVFVKKQKLSMDYFDWIGGEVGSIASFNDQYFFNMGDIKFDVDTKQPKGLILQWQDDSTEYHFKDGGTQTINYKSYTIGLRYE